MFNVTSSTPIQNGTATLDVHPSIAFSSAIDAFSIEGSVILSDEYGDVPIEVTAVGTTLTITPLRILAPNETYELRISTELQSAANEKLEHPFNLQFKTNGNNWKPPVSIKHMSEVTWGIKDYIGAVLHDDKTSTIVWCEWESNSSEAHIVATRRNALGVFGPREVLATGAFYFLAENPARNSKLWRTPTDGAALFWSWAETPTPTSAVAYLKNFRQGAGWSATATIPAVSTVGSFFHQINPLDVEVADSDGVDALVMLSKYSSTPPSSMEIGRVKWDNSAASPTYEVILKVVPPNTPGLGADKHLVEGSPFVTGHIDEPTSALRTWRNANIDSGLLLSFQQMDTTPQAQPNLCLISVIYSFATGVKARTLVSKFPKELPCVILPSTRPNGTGTVFFMFKNGSDVKFSTYSPVNEKWTSGRMFVSTPLPNAAFIMMRPASTQLIRSDSSFELLLASTLKLDNQVLENSLLYDPGEDAWHLTSPPDPGIEFQTKQRFGDAPLVAVGVFSPTTGHFEVLYRGGWASSFNALSGWSMPYRVVHPNYFDHMWTPVHISQNSHGQAISIWSKEQGIFPGTNSWHISERS